MVSLILAAALKIVTKILNHDLPKCELFVLREMLFHGAVIHLFLRYDRPDKRN